MNPTHIEKSIRAANLEVERVSESAFRFVRSYEGNPFAQYFVDCTNALPAQRDLYEYQAALLGNSYFDNPPLQWSSYLYFVLDQKHLSRLTPEDIESVESDRNFARKLVLTPAEFDATLADTDAPATEALEVEQNVEELWRSLLEPHGFDQAVFTAPGTSLENRLQLILRGSTETRAPKKTTATPQASSNKSDSMLQFVREVRTTDFRPKIDGRDFPLADVTLIHGPNGSGKTSLLESIEYFYCGANRRDSEFNGSGTQIKATLADGKSHATRGSTPKKTFKARNLAWYGRRDLRSSTLQDSFARCNFLNVDAAAALELLDDAETDALEALANLVVGPSASAHWKEIVRLNDAIPQRYRRCEAEVGRNEDRLKHHQSIARALTTARKQSESARLAVQAAFATLGWDFALDCELEEVEWIEAEITRLEAELELPAELKFLPKPVTIVSIGVALRDLKKKAKAFEQAKKRYEASLAALEELAGEQEALGNASRLVARSGEYIEAGFENALCERNRSLSDVADIESLTFAAVPDFAGRAALLPLAIPNALQTALGIQRDAEATLLTAISERNTAVAAANELEQLSSSLVAAAEQIREHRHVSGAGAEPCPLCGTEYSPSELTDRILRAAQSSGSVVAASAEKRFATANSASSDAASIAEFVQRVAKLSEGRDWKSLEEAVHAVRAATADLKSARRRVEECNVKLSQLARAGFDESEFSELNADLREFTNADFDETLELMHAAAQKQNRAMLSKIERRTETENSRMQKAKDSMFDTVDSRSKSEESIERAKLQLDARIEAAEEYMEIASAEGDFSPPENVAITEARRGMRNCSTLLGKLVVQIEKETELFRGAEEEQGSIDEELKQQRAELQLWDTAKKAFADIVQNHGLDSATRDELATNRETIEWIFEKIHSPAEFVGLCDEKLTSLVRKDHSTAKLSQISTGQRAALALSVFLAFNRRSVSAPPIMLIDDPIAHVDDLNTLAFLDYLRELAIRGDRQIVFATASSKLAGLFRRKLGFLEEDGRFAEIALESGPAPVSASAM